MPDFLVVSESAEMIAEICMKLDGLPLATELAAASFAIFMVFW